MNLMSTKYLCENLGDINNLITIHKPPGYMLNELEIKFLPPGSFDERNYVNIFNEKINNVVADSMLEIMKLRCPKTSVVKSLKKYYPRILDRVEPTRNYALLRSYSDSDSNSGSGSESNSNSESDSNSDSNSDSESDSY